MKHEDEEDSWEFYLKRISAQFDELPKKIAEAIKKEETGK